MCVYMNGRCKIPDSSVKRNIQVQNECKRAYSAIPYYSLAFSAKILNKYDCILLINKIEIEKKKK